MMSEVKKVVSALLGTAAVLGLADVAHAQATEVGQSGDRNASSVFLEEIVVSARKREENLQNVPISVSAFTDKTMERLQMRELRDVASYTAGFTFEGYANGATATPVIRGLSELNLNDLENNVSTFFDGIYLPRAYMTDPGLFGLERVEILKGPQSATYGRNAFAGAINYVTRAPSEEFGGDAEVTIGTDEMYRFVGTLNVPVIDDHLFLRVGGSYSEWDGSWKNHHPLANAKIRPGTRGKLGGHESEAYFVAARFKPVDTVTIDASYYHFDMDKEFASAYTLEEFAGGLNCAPQGGVNQLYCGRIPVKTHLSVDPRAYGLQSKSDFYRANIAWEITDSLSLTYLFGDVSADATAFGPSNQVYTTPNTTITFLGTPNGEIESRSHELRLAFDNGSNVKMMGGLYHYKTTDILDIRVANVESLQTAPITIPISTQASGVQTQYVTDKAAFGEVSIDMLDKRFNVTAQLRYSEETKKTKSSTTTNVFEGTFKTWAPRVTAQYSLSDDSNVYVSAAKGTKSGGFNATVFDERERSYGPDTNWTYELGSKNRFFDGHLQLNGALYYTKWADLQLNAFPSNIPPGTTVATIILNSGKADSYGIELEAVAVVTDNLTLRFGGSAANPRFEDGQSVQGGITGLCDDIVCASNGDVSGNLLPRQSRFQFNAGFTYERDFTADISGYVQANVAWQSSQELEPQNLASIGDRTVVDASVGMTWRKLDLQLWVKNLLDEVYLSGSNVDTGRNNTRYTPTLGPQRTIGLTGRYSF
jgi:iron complex outermembrane receptor protein